MYSNQGYRTGTDEILQYNFHYFTMPILFRFAYKSFFFLLGPQVDLLFNATVVNQKTNLKEVITGSLNTTQFSGATGIGFMASENIGLEGRYSFSVSNNSNDKYSEEFINHVVQLSIFYVFK